MTKIFKIPFATQGDRTAVPDDVQADGSLSYTQGYGYDYERDQATDPAAKDIEREKMNSIFHDITGAVGEIQAFGMPVWAEEGKPYAIRSVVYHNKKAWQSKIENNNTEPAAGVAWTELKADVTAEDVGAYTKVEANLKFQPVGNYADKNEVNGKLAKDQNGADIPNKDTFIKNLGLPELFADANRFTVHSTFSAMHSPNGTYRACMLNDGTFVVINAGAEGSPSIFSFSQKGEMLTGTVPVSRLTGLSSSMGSSTAAVMNQKGVTDAVNSTLGYKQTPRDMTSSRKSDVRYVNETGSPIYVSATYNSGSSAIRVAILVGGERMDEASQVANSFGVTVGAIVPPGFSYMASVLDSSATLIRFMELR